MVKLIVLMVTPRMKTTVQLMVQVLFAKRIILDVLMVQIAFQHHGNGKYIYIVHTNQHDFKIGFIFVVVPNSINQVTSHQTVMIHPMKENNVKIVCVLKQCFNAPKDDVFHNRGSVMKIKIVPKARTVNFPIEYD